MTRPAITRINGGFQVAANTSNKNNGFYAPQLTTVQRDAIPGTLTNGAIIYNTTLGVVQIYQTVNAVSTWANLSATTSVATGVGLTNGTPITLPSGPRASVEVPANQITGFIYTDTTNNVTRLRGNAGWVTVTVV